MWFLSLRVFGLLFLLFPQCFGQYVLQPSSGVCRTHESSWNFELMSFIESTGVACSDSVSHNWLQVLSIPVLLLACSQDWTCNLYLYPVMANGIRTGDPPPPVDSIKDIIQNSMKVPEFDKHLKKAGGHIGRNVVEITIKTIVWKPLMIKINKLRLRNLDN